MIKPSVYLIHIPKTAGTYVTRFLENELGQAFVREGHTVPKGCLHSWTERFGPEHFTSVDRSECFTISVVRNPFSLLVSMYLWGFPYWPPSDFAGVQLVNWPFRSFRDYVEKITSDYPWIVPEQQRSLFFQLYENGALIPDMVLRQEALAEGLTDLGSRLGRRWSPPAQPINTGRGSDVPSFYDRNMVATVERWCEADLETFGYEFEGKPIGDKTDIDFHPVELMPHVSGRRLIQELGARLRRRINPA